MIFEYSATHKKLRFSAYAWKEARLSSGSIVFGIENYNGAGGVVSQTIPIVYSGVTQVSGSIDLSSLGLTEGQTYTTFYNTQVVASGSASGVVPKMYFERPVLSTVLDEVIVGTSGSIGTQSLQTVCEAGNTTNKDINCNNLVASGNMFCNLSGTGTASITFDGLLGDKITNNGTQFGMDNKLVIPVSGSTFNSLLVTDDMTVGNDLIVNNTILCKGLLSTSSPTIYNKVFGPDGDQFIYFYEGNAQGAYIQWNNTTTEFNVSHPIKPVGVYGELYEHNDAGSVITVTTAGTYYPWATSTSGSFSNMESDLTNSYDSFIISKAGTYQVAVSVSLNASVGAVIDGQIFLNNTGKTNLHFHRDMGSAAAEGAAGMTGLCVCAAGDKLDLRFTSDGNGDAVTIFHCNMNLHRI